MWNEFRPSWTIHWTIDCLTLKRISNSFCFSLAGTVFDLVKQLDRLLEKKERNCKNRIKDQKSFEGSCHNLWEYITLTVPPCVYCGVMPWRKSNLSNNQITAQINHSGERTTHYTQRLKRSAMLRLLPLLGRWKEPLKMHWIFTLQVWELKKKPNDIASFLSFGSEDWPLFIWRSIKLCPA